MRQRKQRALAGTGSLVKARLLGPKVRMGSLNSPTVNRKGKAQGSWQCRTLQWSCQSLARWRMTRSRPRWIVINVLPPNHTTNVTGATGKCVPQILLGRVAVTAGAYLYSKLWMFHPEGMHNRRAKVVRALLTVDDYWKAGGRASAVHVAKLRLGSLQRRRHPHLPHSLPPPNSGHDFCWLHSLTATSQPFIPRKMGAQAPTCQIFNPPSFVQLRHP